MRGARMFLSSSAFVVVAGCTIIEHPAPAPQQQYGPYAQAPGAPAPNAQPNPNAPPQPGAPNQPGSPPPGSPGVPTAPPPGTTPPPPATGPGQLKPGPAFVFTTRSSGQLPSKDVGAGIGGVASSNGARVLINDKHARLVAPGAGSGAGITNSAAGSQMAIASDGSRAAIVHEGSSTKHPSGAWFTPYYLKVFSAAGQTERSFEINCPQCIGKESSFSRSSAPIAFSSPTSLVYNTRCQIQRLEVTAGSVSPIGPVRCAAAWAVSRDGKIWISADKNSRDNWTRQSFSSVDVVDGNTGQRTRLLTASNPLVPILEPFLSPRGDRVCFTRPPAQCAGGPPCIHGYTLSCVSTSTRVEMPVATGDPSRWLEFDDNGDQLAFMLEQGQNRTIMLADFRTGLLRQVDVVNAIAANQLTFLGSGSRLGTTGHGATAYDLSSGWKRQISSKEIGSLLGVPGNPRLILVGTEVGSYRRLSWVTLPE